MAEDLMHYDLLVEDALRGVVRAALARVAEDGLPSMHHFYVGFRTGAPGVDIPDYLRQNFPEEMTIVLQHRFWGLEVAEDSFEVTLSFNKRQERLKIPFSALTSFLDPSVQFGLQFQHGGQPDRSLVDPSVKDSSLVPASVERPVTVAQEDGTPDAGDKRNVDEDADEAGANIVALDNFRKK